MAKAMTHKHSLSASLDLDSWTLKVKVINGGHEAPTFSLRAELLGAIGSFAVCDDRQGCDIALCCALNQRKPGFGVFLNLAHAK